MTHAARQNIVQPIEGFGIAFFVINHFLFMGIILYQINSVVSYKTTTQGTFSIAEAAYVTSLWTQVVVSGVAWVAWTLFFGIIIIANRVTRLHKAYLSSFPVEPTQTHASPALRIGNHSLSAVARRETYRGRPYAVHSDGAVTSSLDGKDATWWNEGEFKAWVDQSAPPPG